MCKYREWISFCENNVNSTSLVSEKSNLPQEKTVILKGAQLSSTEPP